MIFVINKNIAMMCGKKIIWFFKKKNPFQRYLDYISHVFWAILKN